MKIYFKLETSNFIWWNYPGCYVARSHLMGPWWIIISLEMLGQKNSQNSQWFCRAAKIRNLSHQGRPIKLFQFNSVQSLSRPTLRPMNHSTPGLPVHHQLPEFTQTHVHWVSDAIQPSHPLSSPCPPALNLSQHQALFKWVSSLHQVAKLLQFQLQHQSFQWIFRTDFL